GLVHGRFAAVDEEARCRNGVAVDLARRGDAGTDRVDVNAIIEPVPPDDRLARAGGRHDDIGPFYGLFNRINDPNALPDQRIRLLARPADDAHIINVAHQRDGLEMRLPLHAGDARACSMTSMHSRIVRSWPTSCSFRISILLIVLSRAERTTNTARPSSRTVRA